MQWVSSWFPYRIHLTAPDNGDWVWPPYQPDEDPRRTRIVRFQWWKKLSIIAYLACLAWALWTWQPLILLALVALPVRLHRGLLWLARKFGR